MTLKSRIRELLVGATAVVALGSLAAPSQAAFFEMELTVTGGIQAPAGPFSGSFELPNYTGVGEEVFTGDNSQDGPIVDFIATITAVVDGTPTTMNFIEDWNPSGFQIGFANGVYDGMNFLSKETYPFDFGIENKNIWKSFLGSEPYSLIYRGTVDVNLVPVPAALPLFATALGVLAGVGARRRTGLRAWYS